jgi:uncharacterized membrane protein YhaH (DUF805 family)
MNLGSLMFSWSGRIGRAQYWMGYGIQLAMIVFGYICLLYGEQYQNILALVAAIVVFLPAIWVGLAVMAKRYHDRDKSAWWILIGLIPIVGGIWQLVELGLLKGTEGSNDYGPDPCHSFNVADDIEALRRQAGYTATPAMATAAGSASPSGAIAKVQSRSPYTDGRPVFGKRV